MQLHTLPLNASIKMREFLTPNPVEEGTRSLPKSSAMNWLPLLLALGIVTCLTGVVAAEDPHSPDSKAAATMSNGAIFRKDMPDSMPGAIRPPVQTTVIFAPGEHDWKYSHHQSIVAFNHRLYAIWSSSERDEDSPGQRVMYSWLDDTGWVKPRILFQPDIEPDGRLRILTAGGFHEHNGTLVAYAGDYSIDRKSTRLLARTTEDGKTWTEVRDLHVPVCPNHGPQATASGRLIISGNTAFPYTDDPSGLTGWKMSGIYPAAMEPFQDNPATFWDVAKECHYPSLCEGAFFQSDDGVLHMLLRSTGMSWPPPSFHLWESRSTDQGATWDTPRETEFSNTDSKFHFGRLPDGRIYSVGNPVKAGRNPLVLSVSRDGVHFDRHYILGDQHYKRRFDGGAKGGDYSYPQSMVYEGRLYVIVARQKEEENLISVALSDLADDAVPGKR
jgi:hypothetical protein